jgi:N-acetylmuramoyl-L-alanine amidase
VKLILLGLALALLIQVHAAPTFFIDPGHGAGDPGAHVGNLNEADLVFNIATQVQAMLEAQGLDAVLSRDQSTAPALSARVAAANASGARAFVSLHVNFSPSPTVHGPRVFIARPLAPRAKDDPSPWDQAAGAHSDAARSLASALARSLSTSDLTRVNVQTLNLAVLKGLSIPGVMVELGFLSHAESRDRFNDPEFLKTLARRVAQGMINWANSNPDASPSDTSAGAHP